VHALSAYPDAFESFADCYCLLQAAHNTIDAVAAWAVRPILEILFKAITSTKWQVKVLCCKLMQKLAEKHTFAFSRCLPIAIQPVSEAMWDTKADVKKAAAECMLAACNSVTNRDIKPFVGPLVNAIQNPEEVAETVHKLSSTVFVQSVDAPALAVTVPILMRGCQEKKTEIKRKVAVIADNMSKLIDIPREAKPFLPTLMPEIKRLGDEMSDPEARSVCQKALKTLKNIQDAIDMEEAAKSMAPEVCMAALLETVTSTVPAAPVTDATFQVFGEYLSAIISSMINDLYFDEFEWKFVAVCPYLAPFMSEDDAVKTCAELLKRCEKDVMPKEVAEDEDDEGVDLCNCEFSLGYGAKILLNNTRLHLKQGMRYGVCGYNGCGKSTLMRAIANGQVDNFPPPEELKTVYVEHDIQSDLTELTIMDYTCAVLPDIPREVVEKKLDEFGFLDDQASPAWRGACVSGLSGGWKMKLALCRAILMDADILLLDEPTNHLDVKNVAWLENFLISQKKITSMIITHDSGFLDRVVTHIIHYEDNRKLKNYKGNLSAFVKRVPRAKTYYELSDDNLSFTFPEPGLLDGVKSKGKAIIRMENCTFTYPNRDKPTVRNITLQASLSSRVAVIGPNGAGKSTLIKIFCAEAKPQEGTVWRHQNMRIAYVAQHAFHHIENHLDKTPNEYIQWRYSSGEDREAQEQEGKKVTAEEEANMQKVHTIRNEDGTVEKKIVEALRGRRKSKRTYEYEVKWLNKGDDHNTWIERDKLEEMGWGKMVQRLDQQEALRLGLAQRPLTTKFVEQQLGDMGLEAEFATHSRIRGLSGGQKVKVVIAGSMWNNPHILVMDEPTNYLDRDSLGALAGAIKKYGGGVVLISHNREFTEALCPERWVVEDGRLVREGDVAKDEKLDLEANAAPDEVTDSLGNVIKVKKEKKLTARELKKLEKKKAERRKKGLPSDSEEDD
jgi:elongation factor 3